MFANRYGKGIRSILRAGNIDYPLANKRLYTIAVVGFVIAGLLLTQYFITPGKRKILKEIPSMRTENSLTFQNGDGAYTQRLYAKPINYKDESGKWQKIDTSIKTKGSKLQVIKAPYDLYFSSDSKEEVNFKIGKDSVGFALVDIGDSKASVKGSKAVYKNVYMNTDLERIATSTGLKQNYVLRESGHPAYFKETLNTKLNTKLQKDGSIGFYKGDKMVAAAPRPFVKDSKGVIRNASYALQGSTLTTKLPSLKGLKYPIILDPAIEIAYIQQGVDDYYVYNVTYSYGGSSSTTYSVADNLKTRRYVYTDWGSGSGGGAPTTTTYIDTSYLKFNVSSLLSNPYEIASAKLYLKEHPTLNSSSSSTIRIYSLNHSSATKNLGFTANIYNSVDVTSDVQQDFTEGKSYSSFYTSISSGTVYYAASEYTGTDSDPYLEVTFDSLIAPTMSSLSGAGNGLLVNLQDNALEDDETHFYIDTNTLPTTDDNFPIDTDKAASGQNYNKYFANLLPDTKYYIRSRTHDHTNTSYSNYSSELSAYTLANVPGKPIVNVVDATSTRVTIDKNANSDSTLFAIFNNITNQYVQADGTLGPAPVFRSYTDWGGATGVVNTGLDTLNNTYTYKTKAKNGDGVETGWSSWSANNPGAPIAPTMQTPTSITTSSITWNWTDNSNDEDGFVIEDENNNQIAQVGPNVTSFTESSLSEATDHIRHVHAYNASAQSEESAQVTAATLPTTSFGNLSNPLLTSVKEKSATEIEATIIDNSQDEDDFHFYVDTISGPSELAGSPVDTITKATMGATYKKIIADYTVFATSLSPNTKYYVRSRVHDHTAAAFSAYSNELSATTLARTPAVPIIAIPFSPSRLKIAVDLNDNPPQTEFAIFNVETGKYLQPDGSLDVTTAFETYTAWGGFDGSINSNLDPNKSYSYKVKAKNSEGIETDFGPTSAPATTLANKPIELKATTSPQGTDYKVDIIWAEQDLNNKASYYRVYYSIDSGASWTQTGGDLNQTNYTFIGSPTNYKLKVSAFNSVDKASTSYVSTILGATTSFQPNETDLGDASEGDLVIDGNTVTLDGTHNFNSIKIINGGVLTHTANSGGLILKVQNDLDIDATSKIDVSGKGYSGGAGPGSGVSDINWGNGGGGYGSNGGGGSSGVGGGQTYGDEKAPTYMGSSGG
ncbi:hypothetical protein LCGC14_1398890, partial [marine sediment metagenome]